MKIAANLLVAGLLLFGFAAFAFIQNSILRDTTPWYGYICLALSLLFGIFLFALIQFQGDHVVKLSERIEALTNSLNISTKIADVEGKQKVEVTSASDVAQKIAGSINFDNGLDAVAEDVLIKLAKEVSFAHGLLFVANSQNESYFEPKAKFAYYTERELEGFSIGEGINGQAAKDRQPVLLESIPENFVSIVSGLGKSSPRALSIYPVVHNNQTIAILELAFLSKPTAQKLEIIGAFCETIGEKIPSKQLA